MSEGDRDGRNDNKIYGNDSNDGEDDENDDDNEKDEFS